MNPIVDSHHPVLLTHSSARERFHAFLVAALKISDCCHKEHVLLSKVVNQMFARSDSTDYHIGILAALYKSKQNIEISRILEILQLKTE